MAKCMWFVKRADRVDLDAFRTEWSSHHAARVQAVPGVERYSQSFTLAGAYRRGEPRFDCVTELWLDDAILAQFGAQAECLMLGDRNDHLPGLIDGAACVSFVSRDVLAKDGEATGLKSFAFAGPRAGMSFDDFHRYWVEVHGPIGARHPALTRYVQAHASAPVLLDGVEVGGCAMTWFPDIDAVRAAVQSPELADILADEPKFTVVGLPVLITNEHVIVSGDGT